MIESICNNCGDIKLVGDDKNGKKYKCPNCGEIVFVQLASSPELKEGKEEIVENSTFQDQAADNQIVNSKGSTNLGKTDYFSISIGLICGLIGFYLVYRHYINNKPINWFWTVVCFIFFLGAIGLILQRFGIIESSNDLDDNDE